MDDLESREEKNEEERKKIEEGKNRGGKEEGSRHAQEKRDEIFEKLNAGMSGYHSLQKSILTAVRSLGSSNIHG